MMNLRMLDKNHIAISLDETVTDSDVANLLKLFSQIGNEEKFISKLEIPSSLNRSSKYLTHPVFHLYQN